ncbi:ABC transporter D family member 1 [Camellia lanceoleosa]|uniref:ABC transporter D family member 1 n=1 Tax=Camellia lanceoleosa TaxID=1840588 RepID=A0ACC0GUL1_9ERIC|nr:ABC transporter D family member 1 [Camellia lanceoleosa]
MPSLQLLQWTEHGCSLLASKRKTILLSTGVVVAGGTAAYLRSRYYGERPDHFGHYNGLCDNKEQLEKLLQWTEHGCSLLASRRKTILLSTGVVVAGGTTTYLRSRYCGERPDHFGHYNGLCDNKEQLEKVVGNENIVKKSRQKKKGGLKSLQVLASILLSRMGPIGARDLLSLLDIVLKLGGILTSMRMCQGSKLLLPSDYHM